MFENLNVMAFDWSCLCPPFLMFALPGSNSLILEYQTNDIQRLNQYTEGRLASTVTKLIPQLPGCPRGEGRQMGVLYEDRLLSLGQGFSAHNYLTYRCSFNPSLYSFLLNDQCSVSLD